MIDWDKAKIEGNLVFIGGEVVGSLNVIDSVLMFSVKLDHPPIRVEDYFANKEIAYFKEYSWLIGESPSLLHVVNHPIFKYRCQYLNCISEPIGHWVSVNYCQNDNGDAVTTETNHHVDKNWNNPLDFAPTTNEHRTFLTLQHDCNYFISPEEFDIPKPPEHIIRQIDW